jgi:nucleotide-binding universal stress UspA family protein
MKKILCPVDFSDNALNAIHYAMEIAIKEKAELILFHACAVNITPDSSVNFGLNYEARMRSESEEKIVELWGHLTDTKKIWGMVNGKAIVKTGFLIPELVKTVKEEAVDLVIMGTEGAHGLAKVLFGSLTATIIEKVECPVWIVPNGTSYVPIKEIVFATDLQFDARHDLELAISLARLFGAHISMLHIHDHIFMDEMELVEKMEAIMDKAGYKDISLNICKDPGTKEGIYKFAKRMNADLIVMTTESRSFIGKLLSKSLTREMAFSTGIPLLALHKQKELAAY